MTGSLRLPFGKHADRLFMWRDPKISGIVLGGATAVYLLLNGRLSIAWLLSTLVLVLVVVSQCWTFASTFFNKPGPPVPRALKEGISQEQAYRMADAIRKPVNDALGVLGLVLSGKDARVSSLVIGGLSVASYIFRFISFSTLAYSALVLAFTAPKLYEANKERVDRSLAQLQAKSKEVYAQFEEKVLTRVPSQKKKAL